ncbi:MAG: hypothetical protein ACFFCE_02675 [Promethearchaeota archaeon]
MKELDDIPEFSKYFRVIPSTEIDINKEDIFYRDKYNDIINFIKAMLTNHDDPKLNGYIEPKGAILINTNPGTDILDYLKLISKNYYLDIIEIDEEEINKDPIEFLRNFIRIIDDFGKDLLYKNSKEVKNIKSDKGGEKRILLINQQNINKKKLEGKNLLEEFLNSRQKKRDNFKFIDANLIMVWINYNIQDVSNLSDKLYSIFDLFIRIPLINKIERETVLRDFLEKNSKIVFNINEIVNYTENWEVKDVKQLLKVGIFKHFLNSELNETSNEITDILIDLIISGEYIPNIVHSNSNHKVKAELNEEQIENKQFATPKISLEVENYKDVSEIVKNIQESNISEFMLNQLYENAASKYYTELVLIIDKLAKKEPLEEGEMKLIAKYSFILNDSPPRAQINLEKAKKRVDLIKQAFGK